MRLSRKPVTQSLEQAKSVKMEKELVLTFLTLTFKSYSVSAGFFLRKGEVFAYVGLSQNLKELKKQFGKTVLGPVQILH